MMNQGPKRRSALAQSSVPGRRTDSWVKNELRGGANQPAKRFNETNGPGNRERKPGRSTGPGYDKPRYGLTRRASFAVHAGGRSFGSMICPPEGSFSNAFQMLARDGSTGDAARPFLLVLKSQGTTTFCKFRRSQRAPRITGKRKALQTHSRLWIGAAVGLALAQSMAICCCRPA